MTYDELYAFSLKRLKRNRRFSFCIITILIFVYDFFGSMYSSFHSLEHFAASLTVSVFFAWVITVVISLFATIVFKYDFHKIKKAKEPYYDAIVLKPSYITSFIDFWCFFSFRLVKVKVIKGREIGKYKYARSYLIEPKVVDGEIKGRLLLTKGMAYFID